MRTISVNIFASRLLVALSLVVFTASSAGAAVFIIYVDTSAPAPITDVDVDEIKGGTNENNMATEYTFNVGDDALFTASGTIDAGDNRWVDVTSVEWELKCPGAGMNSFTTFQTNTQVFGKVTEAQYYWDDDHTLGNIAEKEIVAIYAGHTITIKCTAWYDYGRKDTGQKLGEDEHVVWSTFDVDSTSN